MADVDGPSDKENEAQPENRAAVLKRYLERGMRKVAPQMVKSIFESLAKVRSGPNGEFESLDGESVRSMSPATAMIKDREDYTNSKLSLRDVQKGQPIMTCNAQKWAVVAVILAASVAILGTAPMAGDFWWSDAPRHALNGAFVKDLIVAHPMGGAKAWAINYYMKYPSLTILFYPPLFYVFEAGVFSVLGVSNFAAQLTVAVFVMLLGAASYGLARFVLPRWSAVAVALLTMGAPSACYWGRQVMLDVPAFAGIVLASYFVARYLHDGRNRNVYFAVLTTLAAIYVRYTTFFIVPVFLLTILVVKGREVLKERAVIGAGVLGAIGMIPAVGLTWLYGRINFQNVGGVADLGDLPRTSIGAWSFYATSLPHDVGYVTIALAVVAGLLLVFRQIRMERWYLWLMIGWLIVGYVLITMINHREERFAIPLMFPLALFAILALQRLPNGASSIAAMAVGLGTLGYSLFLYPTPFVHGYREVADYVAHTAPQDGVVVFSGHRDGNFVFNMRTHEERSDVTTIRATKLLLSVAVDRGHGVAEANYSAEEIEAMLRRLGVGLVVYQPNFWEDLREMALFSVVIHSHDFERIARFQIEGDKDGDDGDSIEIYRPSYPVSKAQTGAQYDMPIINDKFLGTKQ